MALYSQLLDEEAEALAKSAERSESLVGSTGVHGTAASSDGQIKKLPDLTVYARDDPELESKVSEWLRKTGAKECYGIKKRDSRGGVCWEHAGNNHSVFSGGVE